MGENNSQQIEQVKEPSELEKIILNMSQSEQKTLLKQLKYPNSIKKTYEHKFPRKRARFGVISDTHIGAESFDENALMRAFDYFKKEKVDAIYHCGDILEGMSGRPGHVYELKQIGLKSQMKYATDLLSQTDIDIYAITGNHDQWYLKKGDMGVDIGTLLEDKLSNFHYLGLNEADIVIGKDVKMKLIHPNDGSAYATSYKLQKLIESFNEDEKPQLVFEGHYHKALNMYSRGVHGYEAGTLCDQSEFMRLKKLQAHKGAWLIDVYMKPRIGGIDRVTSTFLQLD